MLLLQVLLDQLTFGPFCNAVFMSYIALVVEGEARFLYAATGQYSDRMQHIALCMSLLVPAIVT